MKCLCTVMSECNTMPVICTSVLMRSSPGKMAERKRERSNTFASHLTLVKKLAFPSQRTR